MATKCKKCGNDVPKRRYLDKYGQGKFLEMCNECAWDYENPKCGNCGRRSLTYGVRDHCPTCKKEICQKCSRNFLFPYWGFPAYCCSKKCLDKLYEQHKRQLETIGPSRL